MLEEEREGEQYITDRSVGVCHASGLRAGFVFKKSRNGLKCMKCS